MDIDELPAHLEVCAAVDEKLVPDKLFSPNRYTVYCQEC